MNLKDYQGAASRTSSADGLVLRLVGNATAFPVISTDDVPSRAAWRVANGATGLGAEGGELIGAILENFTEVLWMDEHFKDKVRKELGDIMWYLAEAASGLDIDLSLISLHENGMFARLSITANLMQVTKEAGEAADYLKKLLWHGKKVEPELLENYFGRVLSAVELACKSVGLDVEDVRHANIDKLLKRYEAGFSAEASEARVDLLP